MITPSYITDQVDSMLPVLRDQDGYIYIREWSGGIMAGGFEPISKPVFSGGVLSPFEFQLLPEDLNHFRKMILNCFYQLILAQKSIRLP